MNRVPGLIQFNEPRIIPTFLDFILHYRADIVI